MPEPSATTTDRTLRSLTSFALVIGCLFTANSSAAAQDSELAKARIEAQNLEKPLFPDFEKADQDYRKIRRDILRIVPKGASGRDDQKLDAGIKYHIYRLTDPTLEPLQIQEARIKFERGILDKTASLLDGTAAAKHREKVFGLVTKYSQDLLDGNYYVRANAITLLSSMKIGNQRVSTPYTGSRTALLRIARTSEFPELRLHAMVGLAKLLQFSSLNRPDEMEIAGVLATELRKPGLPNGTYFLLADWLQYVKSTFEIGGQRAPVAVVALVESMSDQKRGLMARARAAYALGLTGEQQTNIQWPLIVWKIAEFAHEAGTAFLDQQGAGEVENPIDREGMLDIVLGMTPADQRALDAGQGILNRTNDPKAKAGYDLVFAVVKGSLGSGVKKKDLDALKAWIDANKPANPTYHPQAPPLPQREAPAPN